MRRGIFGGTFNPVHNGHIKAMKDFIRLAALDVLTVIPTGTPPHKAFERDVTDEQRLKMLHLAADDFAEISDYEIQKGGKSYTVDTLEHFGRLYPEDEIFLYMGSDMLLGFEKVWYRCDDILKMCKVFVLSRTGDDYDRLNSYAAELCERYGATLRVYPASPVVISSSEIRRTLADKGDASAYLPPAVYDYIRANNLYGGAG